MTDDLTVNGPPLVVRSKEPPPTIQIVHEGRTATIDFGGSEVTFGGDLPVSEAARVFFESVHVLRGSARKQAHDEALEKFENAIDAARRMDVVSEQPGLCRALSIVRVLRGCNGCGGER